MVFFLRRMMTKSRPFEKPLQVFQDAKTLRNMRGSRKNQPFFSEISEFSNVSATSTLKGRPPQSAITPFPPGPPERRERDSPNGPPTGLGWPHGGEPGNSRVSLRRNDRPGFLLANQAIAQRSVFKPRTLISPSSRHRLAMTGQGRAGKPLSLPQPRPLQN